MASFSTLSPLSVFCDGGARGNPGPAACAFVIKNKKGKIIHQQGRFLGKATNNVAEYNAVLEAFTWIFNNKSIFNFKFLIFNFFLDSQLVVNQLNGRFKIKNLALQKLALKIKLLEQKLGNPITYQYIIRAKNSEPDRLVNQVLDKFIFS